MFSIILLLPLIMNIAAFVFMGIDKAKARAGKRRIPEKTLFLVTACFGGLGGTLGMLIFRHKTKHWYFKWGFPALMLLQAAVFVLLLVKLSGGM